MEIFSSKEKEILVLKLKGRLDTNASMEFEHKVQEAINDQSKNMVLDFTDLEYICSSGLRVIIQAAKKLKSVEGNLVLCSMQDYIQEVFEISGFDSFLTIFASEDDALNSF